MVEIIEGTETEALSGSAEDAMRGALVAELIGDVVKLRRRVDELEPALEVAVERHAKVATDMIEKQQKQFVDMSAQEIERINASYEVKADAAFSESAGALRKTAEVVLARHKASNFKYWVAGFAALVGSVFGASVVLVAVFAMFSGVFRA